MIYYLGMESQELDYAILKQAIRDVASKEKTTCDKAISYFNSKDFKNLCARNNLNTKELAKSIKELLDYPLLSRKKLVNQIANIIDKSLIKESA